MASLEPGALEIRSHAQATNRAELGRAWQDTGLVFTTSTAASIRGLTCGEAC